MADSPASPPFFFSPERQSRLNVGQDERENAKGAKRGRQDRREYLQAFGKYTNTSTPTRACLRRSVPRVLNISSLRLRRAASRTLRTSESKGRNSRDSLSAGDALLRSHERLSRPRSGVTGGLEKDERVGLKAPNYRVFYVVIDFRACSLRSKRCQGIDFRSSFFPAREVIAQFSRLSVVKRA